MILSKVIAKQRGGQGFGKRLKVQQGGASGESPQHQLARFSKIINRDGHLRCSLLIDLQRWPDHPPPWIVRPCDRDEACLPLKIKNVRL
jgi:hypothetical protein